MLPFLKQLQPKTEEENSIKKKILCIIEGDLEFRYIVKIFKLFGYEKGCYHLSNELITVAWGDKFPKSQNIVNEKCLFQGGSSIKGRKVPFPAIDAFELYNRDLNIFDSVVVFFDGDKDNDNEVENYFKEEFKNLKITNTLLVSIPCFESTLIDFCYCGYCRKIMDYIPDLKYPCTKYKGHKKDKKKKRDKYTGEFRKLPCFMPEKEFITTLEEEMLDNLEESGLIEVNQIIQNFMNHY